MRWRPAAPNHSPPYQEMQKRTAAHNLAEAADRALGASADRIGLRTFLETFIRPEGNLWSLAGHEYLRAIVEDRAAHIVVEKAAQLGLSTLMVGEMLQCCLAGQKAGYFFDTKEAMREFVQSRVDPIIDSSDELVKLVVERKFEPDRPKRKGKGGADNVRFKQIGPNGLAYFLAVNNRGDVRTRALDRVYLDEVSEHDPELAAFVDDRMMHSKVRCRREISQPRIPGMDIDDAFQRSDMKFWKLRCSRCRSWTALEMRFPDCLVKVKDEWRICCPKCHAKLINEIPATKTEPARREMEGEWVALHPDRSISGYHMSQLYGPHITAGYIGEKWAAAQTRAHLMQNFVISILGNPYAGDNQPITEELLRMRSGEWGMTMTGKGNLPPGVAYAGIDVGDVRHLVIYRVCADGVDRVVWLEATRDWDLIRKRLVDHEVIFFAVDALPEKTKAKELCLSLAYKDGRPRGAIVYTSSQSSSVGWEDEDTAPVRVIKTNRTDMLDDLAWDMQAGRFWLPTQRIEEVLVACQHFARLVKDRDRESGAYRYRKNVENHYGMAAAMGRLAKAMSPAILPPPAGHFALDKKGNPNMQEHLIGPAPITDTRRGSSADFFRKERGNARKASF